MTSKEIVKKAIEFKNPKRIPYNFDSNRTCKNNEKFGDDFFWVFAESEKNFVKSVNENGEWNNEWGVFYHTKNTELGEPCFYPLKDIEKVYDFKYPDYSIKDRYEKAKNLVDKNIDKYILAMFPHFLFMFLFDLIGFEDLMIDFYEHEDQITFLIEKLTQSCMKVVENMSKIGCDGIIAIEDLGLQDRLFISPEMWRKFFKTPFKKIVEYTHSKNMHFFLHSCGYIFDLIEDFIEIGVDVLQLDQQDNMGIDNLSKKYAGKIAFFCPCDIQTVLPNRSKKEIENNVLEMIKKLGTKKGGFIAKTYPMPDSINLPIENEKIMCDAVKKFGNYE